MARPSGGGAFGSNLEKVFIKALMEWSRVSLGIPACTLLDFVINWA